MRRSNARRLAVGSIATWWLSAVIFFTGTNRDYEADVRLLQRAYSEWLPVSGFDGAGGYYTQFHPQEVVDSYGYSFQYICYLIERLILALFRLDFAVNSASRIVVQNLTIAALGILTCVMAGRFVAVLTRSWRAEVGTIVLLGVTPLWAGHSWMNQKDIPFAAGFMASTLLAAGLLALNDKGKSGDGLTVAEIRLYSFVAVFLTFGTRPGLAVLVLPLLGLAVLGVWRREAARQAFLAGLAVGTIGVLLTNPAAIPNPVGWVRSAMRIGRDFSGWGGDVYRFGQYIGGRKLGPRYLFFEYFSQLPILVISGMIVAIVMLVWRRSLRIGVMASVAYSAFVIPVVVFAISVNNYNSGRQFLFVVPVWIALGAFGLHHVLTTPSLVLRRTSLLACVFLSLPLAFDHVMLFPYQYIYRNEAFRLIPDYQDRFEFDYWGLAGRQVAADLNEAGAEVIFVGRGATIVGQKKTGRYTDANTVLPFLSRYRMTTDQIDGDYDAIAWLNYWPPTVDYVFRNGLTGCPEAKKVSVLMWPKRIALGATYKC